MIANKGGVDNLNAPLRERARKRAGDLRKLAREERIERDEQDRQRMIYERQVAAGADQDHALAVARGWTHR